MAKLTFREKLELPDLLNRLVHRTKAIANGTKDTPTDIDRKTYKLLCKALHNLSGAVDQILINQKARGKEFLSAEDIDKIFEDLKKENLI